MAPQSILIVVISLNWAGYISYYSTSTTWTGECRDYELYVTCSLLHAINRYQLYVDDILEDTVASFGNKWKLDLFTSMGSPKLVLGAVDDQEGLPYFKGCMKNLAIQFRSVSIMRAS